MDIKEFINKANFYEKENFIQDLYEVLRQNASCNGCPLYKECHESENRLISCVDILKKYLTIE